MGVQVPPTAPPERSYRYAAGPFFIGMNPLRTEEIRMDKEHVFFENYAKHWDRDRKENRTILSEFLRLMALETGAAVLDAGCGTGVLLPYLAEASVLTGR